MKPNYTELGFADKMGPELKALVEKQLSNDLKVYGVTADLFHFDWADSCIEGHDTRLLDGEVENFSGIKVYNGHDNLIAEGWMEFIHEPSYDFFITYWEFLTLFEKKGETYIKETAGIPLHVFVIVPENIRENYKAQLLD
ncbi:hypothetical protein [Mesobacillus maritimus]|uniref:GyrI-like small molecule binding domain-containing protein n=1 Tax=Mesobacillus maritimus TaxID=1643336 RepID=A0ABS7K8F2_9BACI|nr:hypothetical protein [Mesobacillus maritimus]MBY0098539.1 hypothetical protein [Mesobacillus maritimus]